MPFFPLNQLDSCYCGLQAELNNSLTSISLNLPPRWVNMKILPLKLRLAVIVSRFMNRATQ